MTRKAARDDEGPLTVAQAAERLGLRRNQTYDLIYAGKLAHLRYPSRGSGEGPIRVEPAEVDRFKAACRRPATSPG